MGRSITPTFAVEYLDVRENGRRVYWTPAGWPTKHAGRPTAANLARHVAVYEASTLPGGCNAHLGPTRILEARVVRNRGERVVVAAFQAKA